MSDASAKNLHSNPWDSLKNPLFRSIWIATFISGIGSWMHQVADGWLMTTLTPDPLMVSMIQVLSTLPMFILALPAGALADLVDRRKYLLFTQTWMLLASGTMGFLTYNDLMTPEILLFTTFLMSFGVALNSPGWHSVTPEVVSREELPGAVSLNGMALNCARALGPALGGAVLLYFGASVAFFLNSISFSVVILVLLRWKRDKNDDSTPREGFLPAMRGGVRHVRHSPWLKTVLVRAPLFLLSTSILWALAPLLCKQAYGFSAPEYGIMLGVFGLGAVTGALQVLPRVRKHLNIDQIVTTFWIVFSFCLIGLGLAQSLLSAIVCMFIAGISWLCVLANFHFVVQSSAPPWVQGRAMSIYLLFFFGAASVGSAFWGFLAKWIELREVFMVAGGVLMFTSLSRYYAPLNSAEKHNLTPSGAWPDPEVASNVPLDHGPIMVKVEYIIDEEDAKAFREALEQLRMFRYQNGVLQWGIFLDIADPRKYREIYFEDSWGSHLRHHGRVTAFETEVAAKVYAFHKGEGMPPVFHYSICNQDFPTDGGEIGPVNLRPRRYATDSRGVPLWFLDDFQDAGATDSDQDS